MANLSGVSPLLDQLAPAVVTGGMHALNKLIPGITQDNPDPKINLHLPLTARKLSRNYFDLSNPNIKIPSKNIAHTLHAQNIRSKQSSLKTSMSALKDPENFASSSIAQTYYNPVNWQQPPQPFNIPSIKEIYQPTPINPIGQQIAKGLSNWLKSKFTGQSKAAPTKEPNTASSMVKRYYQARSGGLNAPLAAPPLLPLEKSLGQLLNPVTQGVSYPQVAAANKEVVNMDQEYLDSIATTSEKAAPEETVSQSFVANSPENPEAVAQKLHALFKQLKSAKSEEELPAEHALKGQVANTLAALGTPLSVMRATQFVNAYQKNHPIPVQRKVTASSAETFAELLERKPLRVDDITLSDNPTATLLDKIQTDAIDVRQFVTNRIKKAKAAQSMLTEPTHAEESNFDSDDDSQILDDLLGSETPRTNETSDLSATLKNQIANEASSVAEHIHSLVTDVDVSDPETLDTVLYGTLTQPSGRRYINDQVVNFINNQTSTEAQALAKQQLIEKLQGFEMLDDQFSDTNTTFDLVTTLQSLLGQSLDPYRHAKTIAQSLKEEVLDFDSDNRTAIQNFLDGYEANVDQHIKQLSDDPGAVLLASRILGVEEVTDKGQLALKVKAAVAHKYETFHLEQPLEPIITPPNPAQGKRFGEQLAQKHKAAWLLDRLDKAKVDQANKDPNAATHYDNVLNTQKADMMRLPPQQHSAAIRAYVNRMQTLDPDFVKDAKLQGNENVGLFFDKVNLGVCRKLNALDKRLQKASMKDSLIPIPKISRTTPIDPNFQPATKKQKTTHSPRDLYPHLNIQRDDPSYKTHYPTLDPAQWFENAVLSFSIQLLEGLRAPVIKTPGKPILHTSASGLDFTEDGRTMSLNISGTVFAGDTPEQQQARIVEAAIDMTKQAVENGWLHHGGNLKFSGDPLIVASAYHYAIKLGIDPSRLECEGYQPKKDVSLETALSPKLKTLISSKFNRDGSVKDQAFESTHQREIAEGHFNKPTSSPNPNI